MRHHTNVVPMNPCRVAGDVVDVAPTFDPSGITALAGATMLFEIPFAVAESIVERRETRGV
jgi:hypothetical protein